METTIFFVFMIIVATIGAASSIWENVKPRHKYVIAVGGGIASTILLVLHAIAKYGYRNVDLFMARLPNEHPDVMRLVRAIEGITGLPVEMIGSGKNPFDVFHEVGRLGNSLIAPCSHILKQQESLIYLEANYDKANTTLLVGIGYYEQHRMIDITANWRKSGWKVEAPLIDDMSLTREATHQMCRQIVGWLPEMYELGFEHLNCYGACVRQGKGGWARLLWYYPAVYAKAEAAEIAWQQEHGPFTILRDERKDGTYPCSLTEHRQRMQDRWSRMKPTDNPFSPPFVRKSENGSSCKACEAI